MNNNIRIILFLIISIFFAKTTKSQDSISIDKVIAVVGKKMILESDIETQYLQYKARGISMGENMKCTIFEDLLFQTLLLNQAAIDSIEVTDKQVEGELENRLRMFEKQMGGQEELEKYFNKTMPEIKDDFRSIVKDQLLTQRMKGQITDDVLATPLDVRNFYKTLPKDSLPLIESESEIAQIVIYPVITQEQKNRVKERLEEIKKRIQSGEDFSPLAVMYSEDPGSAPKGGELGFISRGDLVAEFAAAAFSLRTPGELSDIVESEYGYHLIQLVDRKGERISVRHILMKPQVTATAKREAKRRLDSIANLIRTSKYKFAEAAEKFSQDEKSNKNSGILINPYNGTTKFTTNDIDPATNYALGKIKIGEISEAFENQNSQGKTEIKIMMVNSKTEAHIASLENDYQKICDMALNAKKEKVVSEWIAKKQKTTYVSINEDYQKCPFKFTGWLKNN